MFNKFLPMTGVEPQTSGIESDRSTNWATTTSKTGSLCALRSLWAAQSMNKRSVIQSG